MVRRDYCAVGDRQNGLVRSRLKVVSFTDVLKAVAALELRRIRFGSLATECTCRLRLRVVMFLKRVVEDVMTHFSSEA